jgi:hypothetical protein
LDSTSVDITAITTNRGESNPRFFTIHLFIFVKFLLNR